MKKAERSEIACRLKQLPMLEGAIESLDEQIKCACLDLEQVRRREESTQDRKRDIAHREFLIYEQLVIQRNAIFCKQQEIKHALSLLPDEDRALLLAFFSPDYTKDTPFDLMERNGYEKSQLYFKRAQALDLLAQYLAQETR